MKGDSRFMGLPKSFWADVRTIGEAVGYSKRNQNQVGVPTLEGVRNKYAERGLGTQHLCAGNKLTPTGQTLFDYFQYRADVLNRRFHSEVQHLPRRCFSPKLEGSVAYGGVRPLPFGARA